MFISLTPTSLAENIGPCKNHTAYSFFCLKFPDLIFIFIKFYVQCKCKTMFYWVYKYDKAIFRSF